MKKTKLVLTILAALRKALVRSHGERSFAFILGAVLIIAGAPCGRADTIENLTFTGMATCVRSSCLSIGDGPVTGSYTLDVTTQKIVGAWSFTLPFGVISSSDKGVIAGTSVYEGDNNVFFNESTNAPLFQDFIQFFFPITDTLDLGPIDTAVNSDACYNYAGGVNGSAACEPGYVITGSTTDSNAPVFSAPEPSNLMLLGLGALGMAGMRLKISTNEKEN